MAVAADATAISTTIERSAIICSVDSSCTALLAQQRKQFY